MKIPHLFTRNKLALLALLIAPGALHAQTTLFYWDPTGPSATGSAGSGTWSASLGTFYNSSTSSDGAWGNTTSDTAVFGPAGASSYTVTTSGTVNASGITFANTGNNISVSGSGTINGPTGGTFVTTDSIFFPFDNYNNLTFSNASTYQFVTNNTAVTGDGQTVGGTTKFNGNVVLGNGTDEGEIQWNVANGATGTITVNGSSSANHNGGWSLVLGNGTFTYNDSLVLNGFGTRGNGTIAFLNNKTIVAGPISLTADASIFSQSSGSGTNTNTVSGAISGNQNLYLGFWNNQTAAAAASQVVISGTSNTYKGATIIVNGANGDNTAGATEQTVVLGATNALPTTTALVLGVHGTTAAVANATAANTLDQGFTGGDSHGVLDMNGKSQTVGTLTTGAGQTTANLGLNQIGNNSGGGVSTLTISGNSTSVSGGVSTTNSNTSGTFAGTIEDNFGTAGGKVAVALSGGSETLSGSNTYTGGTTVTGGTLTAGVAGTGTAGAFGTGALGLSGGTVSLNNFAQTVGAFTLSGNGAFNFGTNTSTTLTASSMAWTGGSGSLLTFNLASGGSGSDLINLGTGLLTLNGSGFNIALSGGSLGQTYDLINFGSGSTVSASQFTESSGLAGQFAILNGDELVFESGATPEPSTWALLLGGVALLGLIIRRRSFNS